MMEPLSPPPPHPPHSESVKDSCKLDMNPSPVTIEEALAAPKSASNSYASELALREVEHLVEQHNAYDTPWLLPKHKIFISHSGMQKDFAEQLCEDLETHGYYPFFDKRSDSLPKGEKFPPLIFKAARECLLAIVLLSEDFFTMSKWPMLELAAFVQAQKTRKDLRILPVLLGLTIKDLGNTAKWAEFWIKWGLQDQRLTGDVITEWEKAVEAVRPFNMILKSSYDGEVTLRKGIVGFINKMMPPDIRYDVLNVQGRERLCKEVRSMLDTIPSTSSFCENAAILGLYGIGGVGKSTLCMIITEYVRSEFLGRVSFVELGKETSAVNLQRQMLRQLCRDNEEYLIKHLHTENEGLNRLRERMSRERVFLALDNVSDDAASIRTAMSFLRLKFHPKSMVLVTSRSNDVLCRSLGIPKGSCMRCPSITKDEGLQILLEQVNLPFEKLDTKQTQVLQHTVELSFFDGYHPLALQLFAAQLGTDPSNWKDVKLNVQWSSDLEHPLFSKIETNYMRLPDQHTKDMFMDIALFTPECLCRLHEIIWWLNNTINLDCPVEDKLRILMSKSLIEIWKMEDETVRMHDLYRLLAERNASVDNGDPRFIYQRGGISAPKVLLDNDRARIVERAAFVEAKFEMLRLEACTKLQVLSIRRCEKLNVLCIQRMGYLVSLELAVCPLESLDLSSLSNLRWLHVSSCENLMKLDASEVQRLRHVNVSKCNKLKDLNFQKCPKLRSVSILYNDSLRHVNLGSGESLECLTLWFCGSLTHVEIIGVVYLTTLKKRGCPQLLAMQGGDIMCRDLQSMLLQSWGKLSPAFIRALEISASLQVLDIWHSCISRLPDLRTCLHLQELRLSDVDVLLDSNNKELLQEYEKLLCISVEDVNLPVSLEDIRIVSCRNVVVKEIFWKVQGLGKLRLLLLQEVRVGWDWELYRSRQQGERSSLALEEEYARIRGDYKRPMVCEENEAKEMSMLKEEINVVRQQLSMGMQHRTSVSGDLNEIMQRVQFFLDGKTNLSQHWKTGADHLQQDLGRMFWSSMSKAVEIRGSPSWVVERIIHKMCNNCDSLCEYLQQLLSKDWPQGDNIRCLLEFCQKVHVKEIHGQLLFLTAKQSTDIVQQCNVLEMWEMIIIEEVSAMWRTPTCKIGNDTLIMPRLETFVKRLETLCVCRGWEMESSVELKGQELTQFAWDWLLACRVCLYLEQLKGCLAKESEQRELHLHEVQELLRHIDVIFKTEVEKLREDDLASERGCSFDRFSELIRCWKVRQWLQEVESFLSEHLMQEQKSLPVKEVCESMNEIKKQLNEIKKQLEPFEMSVMFEGMETMKARLNVGKVAALKLEAEWLIVKMSQEWPDTESLYTFLGVESYVKERVRENVDALCRMTEIFFEHIMHYLWNLEGKVRESVSDWTANLRALMISLPMQQWQCRKYLGDSISIGGKRIEWRHAATRYTVVRDNSIRVEDFGRLLCPAVEFSWDWAETLTRKLTEEMQFMELVLHPSNMAHKQGAHIANTWYVWERAASLAALLSDELDFLLYAQTYHGKQDLFCAELKGLWEREGMILFVRLDNFMTSYQHFVEAPLQKNLDGLMRDLYNFNEPFLAADGKRTMLNLDKVIFRGEHAMKEEKKDEKTKMLNVGKLSAVIVGGGHVVKKEKKSGSGQMYTIDYVALNKKPFSMNKMASKMKRLLGGVNFTKKPNVKLEMEGLELAIQAPSPPFFVEMWDNVNSKQLLSLPFSQCSGLRNLYISNCGLTNPRLQLSGQWTSRVERSFQANRDEYSQAVSGGSEWIRSGDEYSQVPLGLMHFSRLDCPSAGLDN